jgi:DNA-binding NtrC family response regulator
MIGNTTSTNRSKPKAFRDDSLETPSVLIASSDGKTLGDLQSEVSRLGLAPISSSDTSHVLESAVANTPSLMILDESLPGASTSELLKELRSLGILSPYILLVSMDSAMSVIRAMQLGAYECLAKPVESDSLSGVE